MPSSFISVIRARDWSQGQWVASFQVDSGVKWRFLLSGRLLRRTTSVSLHSTATKIPKALPRLDSKSPRQLFQSYLAVRRVHHAASPSKLVSGKAPAFGCGWLQRLSKPFAENTAGKTMQRSRSSRRKLFVLARRHRWYQHDGAESGAIRCRWAEQETCHKNDEEG